MKGFVVNYLRQFLAECDQAEADLQFKAEAILKTKDVGVNQFKAEAIR